MTWLLLLPAYTVFVLLYFVGVGATFRRLASEHLMVPKLPRAVATLAPAPE